MRPRSITAQLTLLPLSKLYGVATWVRNKMFDWGILHQHKFDIPVIVVGNIAVGGTGKTPHTEYIVETLLRLRPDCRIGVLSRGYKRATKGFVAATPHSSPRDIGDEAYQTYRKFSGKVDVAVCEKRVQGIQKMREINPELQILVLDDAFQHRYVKPTLAIVLTEYLRPVFSDKLLPYGHLRESARALNRANIVIATKCPPGIKPIEYSLFDKNMDLIPAQSLFFSRYQYETPKPLFPEVAVPAPALDELTSGDMLLSVTGIANPRPFVKYLKSFAPKVKVNVFADHHQYTRRDMDLLIARFDAMHPKQSKYILTTEKDAMRLISSPYFPHQLKPYIFYIPVTVQFIERDNQRSSFEQTLERMMRGRLI